MRAIRFENAGNADVIKLVEEPVPQVRPHDLLVRVYAAGLNRADILQRQGFYGERPDFGDSVVPGLEIAGEVVELGAAATGFRNGDRVMAIVGGGARAEYARVDSRMAMVIPDRLSDAAAAAIPEVFVTAHEALIHLGKLTSGGWALIHAAAGGVGSAAVILAHALGAKTVFTASSRKRIERINELGGYSRGGLPQTRLPRCYRPPRRRCGRGFHRRPLSGSESARPGTGWQTHPGRNVARW